MCIRDRAPVIKIAANPHMYARLSEDMDVNAGRVLQGTATLEDVGQESFDLVLALASGVRSKSEELGHQESVSYTHLDVYKRQVEYIPQLDPITHSRMQIRDGMAVPSDDAGWGTNGDFVRSGG